MSHQLTRTMLHHTPAPCLLAAWIYSLLKKLACAQPCSQVRPLPNRETRLACATPSKGNLKRFWGIKLQISYANVCRVKNRYGANGNVSMAMAQILFSHAWCMGSGNRSRPRLLPRSFLVLTSGAGGGASKSSFLILKQPAVSLVPRPFPVFFFYKTFCNA